MEMNVPVAITFVIGMIGFISWFLVKKFEDKMRVNPTLAGDGLVGIESGGEETEQTEQTEEEEETEQTEETEEADDLHDPNFTATAIESDEVLDGEMDIEEVEKEVEQEVEKVQAIQTDIDTFHVKIEEIDNKLEVTRNLVTELCATVIDTNNSTKNHFNKTLDTLENKMITNVQDIAYSTATNLSRIEASTNESLSTFRNSLDKYAKSTMTVTDVLSSVQTSLVDFATSRDLNDLKTQMDELVKRSTIRKSVYQAWNGSAKWTDFNEGELNIQMIRKKFMTTEQNEDWLLPENKKIAAYNRDQLLGLNEDTWTTTDNTVFVKRYYKDDWDASIEVAITVTLSKKILVPPGGKPETIITHILKRLSEKEQITWEHLLVNV